jgi:hypothetical protein
VTVADIFTIGSRGREDASVGAVKDGTEEQKLENIKEVSDDLAGVYKTNKSEEKSSGRALASTRSAELPRSGRTISLSRHC